VNESLDREERLFQEAVKAFETGHFDKARSLFQEIVALKGRRRSEAERYLDLIRKPPGSRHSIDPTPPPGSRNGDPLQSGSPRPKLREEPKSKRNNPIENSAISGGDPGAYPPPQEGPPPRPPYGGPEGGRRAHPLRGRVKWFDDSKGFGFITREDGQNDCFVHHSSIQGNGFKSLAEGDPVEFDVVLKSQGATAENVVKIPREPVNRGLSHAEPDLKATPSEILRRTPHMNLNPPPPILKSTPIQVSVYTDTESLRAGEKGEAVVLEAPPDQARFDLSIWLVVEKPFEVEGPAIQDLTILRDQERSEPAVFTVVRKRGGGTGTAIFSALFAYNGRPCGKVSRTVPLAADVQGEEPPAGRPAVRIEPLAEPADLNVQILKSAKDERIFQCKVQTFLLPAYRDGVTEEWRLSSLAADVVRQQMAQFTAKGASDWDRKTALLGAGMKLFQAAPSQFQRVFWELVDSGKSPKTISIVTQEPYIPWELMVPNRRRPGGKIEKRMPLGVEFLLSRWSSDDGIHPPQKVSLRDAYVVAPRDSKLKTAEDEAKIVMDGFQGVRIDPAAARTLDEAFQQHGPTLLHFVCHGKSGAGGSQVLLMEKTQELYASALAAMQGIEEGFAISKPLVFLNACEVGRQEPALIGIGGFAEEFMSLGASAVIAPLWSVKDSIAHEIAVEFYRRVKAEPATPFTAILRDLRAKSYAKEGGEDTYAAYCFYGDPLARAG